MNTCGQCGHLIKGWLGIDFDPHDLVVVHNGKSVRLRGRDWQIFMCLYKAGGEPISDPEIKHAVWSTKKMSPKIVVVHITSLRAKLKKIGLNIESTRCVGYKLTEAK